MASSSSLQPPPSKQHGHVPESLSSPEDSHVSWEGVSTEHALDIAAMTYPRADHPTVPDGGVHGGSAPKQTLAIIRQHYENVYNVLKDTLQPLVPRLEATYSFAVDKSVWRMSYESTFLRTHKDLFSLLQRLSPFDLFYETTHSLPERMDLTEKLYKCISDSLHAVAGLDTFLSTRIELNKLQESRSPPKLLERDLLAGYTIEQCRTRLDNALKQQVFELQQFDERYLPPLENLLTQFYRIMADRLRAFAMDVGWLTDCREDTRMAARRGHLDCLKLATDRFRELGWREAAEAAGNGHVKVLEYMHKLEGGAWTHTEAITHGIIGNHYDCVKFARDAKCPWPANALTLAVKHADSKLLAYVYENGACSDKFTLGEAIRCGLPERFKFLVENRSQSSPDDVHLRRFPHNRHSSQEALVVAVQCEQPECVSYLVRNCGLRARDLEDAAALAAENGSLQCLRHLHKSRHPHIVVLSQTRLAATFGKANCLRFLLTRYADQYSLGEGKFILDVATQSGQLACLEVLYEHDPQLFLGNTTVAITAAYRGSAECLNYVLSKGADLSAQVASRVGTLAAASNLDCLKVATRAGAKLTSAAVVQAGSLQVLQYLYEQKVPFDDPRAYSRLAGRGNVGAVSFLFAAGCPPDAVAFAEAAKTITRMHMSPVTRRNSKEVLQFLTRHRCPRPHDGCNPVCTQMLTLDCAALVSGNNHTCPPCWELLLDVLRESCSLLPTDLQNLLREFIAEKSREVQPVYSHW